jgi:hypothetical protein
MSAEAVVKHVHALAFLPLLAAFVACSGNGTTWSTDGGTPGDDGSTPAGDGGTNPGSDSSTPPPPTNAPLATNLAVTGVTIDQAVEINVVKNGATATHNAPIVAGRRGVVRVFVTPGSGWSAHSVTGVLTLHTAGQDHTFTASLSPKSASADATFGSTFNFNVDAASLGTDTTYLVQLKDPTGPSPGDSTAQWPNSGTPASLGVQTSGVVKINIIPVKFTNGLTPDVGGVDVNAYTAAVMDLYPATAVQITVGAVYNYSGAVPDAFDNNYGWDYLLQAIQQKRAADPTPDVYYYGAFKPASSFASYCGSGCIAGLSGIPSSPNNYSQKASIGLVYGGNSQAQLSTGNTMAHEVGHGHGRSHAPTSYNVQGCSTPSGLDPSFPYANGGIGVWGYDLNASKPIDPSQNFDIMGYCAYVWVSDYTYKALFNWVAADNGADMITPSAPVTYRMIMIHGDGTVELRGSFPVYGPMSGEQHTVTYVDNGVTKTVTGYYFPYDHVSGGYILAPEPAHFTSVLVPDFTKAPLKLAP